MEETLLVKENFQSDNIFVYILHFVIRTLIDARNKYAAGNSRQVLAGKCAALTKRKHIKQNSVCAAAFECDKFMRLIRPRIFGSANISHNHENQTRVFVALINGAFAPGGAK